MNNVGPAPVDLRAFEEEANRVFEAFDDAAEVEGSTNIEITGCVEDCGNGKETGERPWEAAWRRWSMTFSSTLRTEDREFIERMLSSMVQVAQKVTSGTLLPPNPHLNPFIYFITLLIALCIDVTHISTHKSCGGR